MLYYPGKKAQPTQPTSTTDLPFVASLAEADLDYEGPGQDATQRRAATPKTERRDSLDECETGVRSPKVTE